MATRKRLTNRISMSTSVAMPVREGRDEMNLTEFPIALLAKTSGGQKTVQYKIVSKGRDGRLMTREWIITGSDKHGLPIAQDEEIYIALMELAHRSRFETSKTHFSRYELIELLGYPQDGRSYKRVVESLHRLAGVRIIMNDSFWDNKEKKYVTANVGLFQQFKLVSEKSGRKVVGAEPPKESFVQWNEDLFASFSNGFIKYIDCDFYFSLATPTAKRLYRFLDKRFYKQNTLTIQIKSLAHEHIGVSRNITKTSHLFRALETGLRELRHKGFLSHYERDGENLNCARGTAARKGNRLRLADNQALPEQNSNEDQDRLVTQLTLRGVTATAARSLMSNLSKDDLDHVSDYLEYFDYLTTQRSYSPGFLVYIIQRRDWQIPPNFQTTRKAALRNAEFNERQKRNREETALLDAYHAYTESLIESLWANLSGDELQRLSSEARKTLTESNEEIGKYFRRCIQQKNTDEIERCITHEIESVLRSSINPVPFYEFVNNDNLIQRHKTK